jgi:hypothetical protein
MAAKIHFLHKQHQTLEIRRLYAHVIGPKPYVMVFSIIGTKRGCRVYVKSAGITNFSEINNYMYVDKTDLTGRLQHKQKYIFLDRQRRFSKSLLSSIIDKYDAPL